MNTKLRKKLSRKVLPVVVALIMVFTLMPMSVHAAYDETFTNAVGDASVVTLGTEAVFGGPQPSDGNYYQFTQSWKKFTIASPSLVTIKVETFDKATYTTSYHNGLNIEVYGGTAASTYKIYDALGSDNAIEVRSDVEKTVTKQFKLLGGTYYLKGVEWTGSINGYGTVTVTAQDVASDPEPNDTKILASPINIGTQYNGLINWWFGQKNTNDSDSQEDWHDYYKLTTTENNTTVRLDFSRTEDGTEKAITADIRPADSTGGSLSGAINLKQVFSDNMTWTLEKAGVYYLFINGWGASYGDATEYTFKLTQVVTPRITLPEKASVDKGKTVRINRTVEGSAESDYEWSSSNTDVATVSVDGVVKGIAAGYATITAKSKVHSNLSAHTNVTVTIPVTKIKLNKTTATIKMKKSKKLTLKATISPKNATVKTVKWTTSNKKIATVNQNGVVTAKKKGKVTITATSNNKKIAKCKITVKK
jgi:uncharacterized protein YjdB